MWATSRNASKAYGILSVFYALYADVAIVQRQAAAHPCVEAVVGFVNRTEQNTKGGAIVKVPAAKVVAARRTQDMTANDRRFLRSLRIAADEAKKEEVE